MREKRSDIDSGKALAASNLVGNAVAKPNCDIGQS